MASLNLLEPVSADTPCGPDLEQADDQDFLDYYYEAESSLPERYFTPGNATDGSEDRIFDPRSVELRDEMAKIAALLTRSRDLRLMGLLARFQILAGKLPDFTETVEDMAAALGQWPDEIHPQITDGVSDRRAAIEALNSQPTVVMPLLHLPLLPNSDVTLRRFMVAGGKAEPRNSELDVPGSDILAPLRTEGNHRALAAANEQLCRVADALHRIRRTAQTHPDRPFAPEFGAVRAAVADLQQMIATARPDLHPWSENQSDDTPIDAATDAPPAAQADVTATSQIQTPQKPGNVPTIINRPTVVAALDAAQAWLAAHEPSSPALLLVAQARLLVGAPLVEAIEILLPDRAGASVMNIGQGTGFQLSMNRLRELTQKGLSERPSEPAKPAPLSAISRRQELVGFLLGVEHYYAVHEPASPVPLLLAKAREMLDKRFEAIMAELLAAPRQEG